MQEVKMPSKPEDLDPKLLEFCKKREKQIRAWIATHPPEEKLPIFIKDGEYVWLSRSERRKK